MLSERVMWTQGMRVSPIHMQHQDRYVDVQLRRRGALSPYLWGFTKLALDESLLALGKIALSEAQGILPDGTLFDIGRNSSLVLDVEPGVTGKLISLTLPLSVEGSLESRDESTMGLSTRYIRTSSLIKDHHAYKEHKTGEASILCGSLDLRLMFDEGSLDGFVKMPVAKVVECQQDGKIILEDEFLPTFLHLEASPILQGYLRELLGLIGHRATSLADRINSVGQTSAAEVGDFMLLQCLNRMEPLFQHMSNTPQVHPEMFYRLLLELVGEVSTFAEQKKRPSDLGTYQHAEQYASFATVMEAARYVLSMVLEQHAILLRMHHHSHGVMVAPLHDKNLLHSAVFVLVARADMEQEELRTLLPKQIKIGTPENIRELVNTHLPGIKIIPMSTVPRQIPFHAGRVYFQLDFSSSQRAQVEVSTGCALHVSGVFHNLTLQLWAVKE